MVLRWFLKQSVVVNIKFRLIFIRRVLPSISNLSSRGILSLLHPQIETIIETIKKGFISYLSLLHTYVLSLLSIPDGRESTHLEYVYILRKYHWFSQLQFSAPFLKGSFTSMTHCPLSSTLGSDPPESVPYFLIRLVDVICIFDRLIWVGEAKVKSIEYSLISCFC